MFPVQAHKPEQQRIRERVVSFHGALCVEVCGWGLSHVLQPLRGSKFDDF